MTVLGTLPCPLLWSSAINSVLTSCYGVTPRCLLLSILISHALEQDCSFTLLSEGLYMCDVVTPSSTCLRLDIIKLAQGGVLLSHRNHN